MSTLVRNTLDSVLAALAALIARQPDLPMKH